MSKTLPAGWEEKTLGEIATIKGGKRVPKGHKLVTYDTGHPYIRVADFNSKGSVDLSDIHFIEDDVYRQISRYTISSRDLYISIAGTIGKSGIIPPELEGANLTENACKLILNTTVSQKFLYYFTLTSLFLSQTIEQTKVAGQPKLALARLTSIKLIFPPLSEQKRIVEKLDKIFANIDKAKENTKKNLQNAKEVFNSALIEAFIIHNAVESYLKDICIKKQNKNWKDENDNAVYYYIDLSSVDRNTNSIGEVQEIKKSNAPSRAQQIIKKGDILFGTTRPTLKRLCIVPNEFDNHICSTGFCVLRADLKKVIPVFLFYALSHPSFYEYIEPLQRGASYPAVTDKDVLNFKIPLPSLEEQKKIVAQLDALRSKTQEMEQIYTKKLADLDELKQSILQQAFSGKL
jgi:type I restriction enzyme S subunit